ncbi:uncharacterized protein LOC119385860 [Rhipicephalus sanguineus]|uniref:uncharacterized protein LOC119385860 n=1 Tax=Rhipicephalus sanguineus TaxID=34632 RepID=UPI0018952AB4|nr:uncharacterized protein LOC119385860 [Rhipicephalus sanguineus]
MAHDADPRGDSHPAGTVADVAAAPFSALPVKEIAVKDFVPVHLAGSAGAAKVIGAHNSLAKVKNACHFEPDVPYATGVRAAIRSSSPELRRSPREDNDRRSSSLLPRYIQFPSDGSLLTESSAFREQRSLQRLAGHIPCGPGRAVLRRTKLRAQRSAMSELWKKPRRNHMGGVGVDAHARSEPPPHSMLLPEGDDELASTNDTVFGARRSRFLREDIQPCTSFVGISSSTTDRYCCRDRASSSCLPGASSLRRLERPPASSESRGRCQLDRLRPSGCRQQKRRRVRVSSSSRTDDYEDDLLLARLEDHAACAKLSLSELRCPAGKLRTSDMFVGGGRRCRSADVVEVARNVVIWVLVLSGTATIMFGAVGIIVLRTGSVMFLSSAVGCVLTTAGVLMAIYCTDASTDRGLQRMMNHKYNYT